MSGSAGAPAPLISIACPMYNEVGCVLEFVRRCDTVLREITPHYEIVIASDGSTDGTNEKIRELVPSYPRLRGVFLSRNMGQCQALYAAIQHTTGRYVVVMDGDLQNPPEEIPRLLAEIQNGHDLVSGLRQKRGEHYWLRMVPSRIANKLLRAVTDCPARDMGGFKILRGDIARSLRLRAGQHRLLPALVYQRGGSVVEIPVAAHARFAGKTHYGLSRTLDVAMDIAMLWFESSFKARPLYLFGRISLLLVAANLVVLAILTYQRLFDHIDLTRRPLFFVALTLFSVAFSLVALGFTLELLSDARNTVNDARPYIIRETVGFANASTEVRSRDAEEVLADGGAAYDPPRETVSHL